MDRKASSKHLRPLTGGLTGLLIFGTLALHYDWPERIDLAGYTLRLFLSPILGAAVVLLVAFARAHHWVRFSLRALLLLMTGLCLALGWLAWDLRTIRHRQEGLRWLETRGAVVDISEWRKVTLLDEYKVHSYRQPKSLSVSRVRQLLGDKAVIEITVFDRMDVTDAELLFPEAEVVFKPPQRDRSW